jgi:hypothetical protein
MLLPPGKTFAMLSLFDSNQHSNLIPSLYSTTSGCRSLIMLNKLTHAESNNRLSKKLEVRKYLLPKNLSEQWFLFNEIANSKNFETNWYSEILLFTKDFVNKIHSEPRVSFNLLNNVWQAVSLRRNEGLYDFIISAITKKIPRSLINDPLVIYIVKHLLMLLLQEAPAYIPADNNFSGPVKDFCREFVECYKIRFHYPVFMCLAHYDSRTPVYYSLQKNSFFYDMPVQSKPIQTINLLVKVKRVFEIVREFVLGNNFEHDLRNTILYNKLGNTEFEFYHPRGKGDINSNILQMVNEDKRFLNPKLSSNLTFPEHSIFFYGCIRIKPKKIKS